MPIYEFVCSKCKNKFELMRPFSKSGEGANCPQCKNKAERVLSPCYSFSTSEGGVPQPVAGSGGGCSSCSSGSCGTCGSHN